MCDSGGKWAQRAVEHIRSRSDGGVLDPRSQITVNFHPDRVVAGKSVIDWLVADGVYRSQFETGISNGGLTARPGGDRWNWEQRIFAGVYDHAPAEQRPKYGALNDRALSVGGSIRFGSCHLRLAPHALERTTFCFPDSAGQPRDFATADRFGLMPLLETWRNGTAAMSIEDISLDDYVEAHIHGPLRIEHDVTEILLDPSFRGTEIETAAGQLGVPVGWTEGRALTVAELRRHSAFRGAEVVQAGMTMARDGRLDARIIGEAAARGSYDPQLVKRVWHVVARYGVPTDGIVAAS